MHFYEIANSIQEIKMLEIAHGYIKDILTSGVVSMTAKVESARTFPLQNNTNATTSFQGWEEVCSNPLLTYPTL